MNGKGKNDYGIKIKEKGYCFLKPHINFLEPKATLTTNTITMTTSKTLHPKDTKQQLCAIDNLRYHSILQACADARAFPERKSSSCPHHSGRK